MSRDWPPPSRFSSAQETLVIRAKKIHTVVNGTIENGTIVIENGKIVKVGRDVPVPAGARVIEAETVIPGMIDIHGHLGVYPVPVVEENLDGNEATNPVTPQVRALDSFDFDDPAIPAALAGGVTTVVSRPGSLNVICGTSVAVKMKKASPAEMVLKEDCDLKMAIEGNPSGYYANLKQMPSTVMAVYFVARKAFTEAREYQKSWETYESDRKAGKDVLPPKRDFGKETLVRALKREIPVHIHCYTPSQIMSSIRLADEFGFRLSLGHSDKAYLIVDELAKRKDIYVNVGPAVFDIYNQNSMVFANVPAILAAAGIKVSLQTDAGPEQQNLRQFASLCVRYGMTEQDALRSITIWAAQAVDLAGRIGSIEPGKDADLVLLDGAPFEFLTSVRAVLIDGKVEYQNPSAPSAVRVSAVPGPRPSGSPAGGDGRRPIRPEGRDRLHDGRRPDRGRRRPGQGREDRKGRQGRVHPRRLSGHRRREFCRHARARPSPDAHRPGLELEDAVDDRRELQARDPRDRGQARRRAPGHAFLPGRTSSGSRRPWSRRET